jgi:hypothetical protein
MKNVRFYCVVVVLILISILMIIPFVLSYLTTIISIQSYGKILTIKTPITQKSEIRGVFIHEGIYGIPHNWTLIAETLASYGINAVFVNDQGGLSRRPDSEITAAINAFHAYGIEYHSTVRTLGSVKFPGGVSYGTEMIRSNGQVYDYYWHCPIKAHDYILDAIRWYIGNHSDVDGIMWDYIRYPEADTCYCEHCKAVFDEWYYQNYGEHVSNWTEFYPGQSKWTIYAEWKNIPINTLVRDLHDLVKSINPNIVISVAAWTLFDDCPIYWRKWIGQDTAYWIKEGYIDFVAPMMYTKEITGSSSTNLANCTIGNLKYWMGGQPEGPIPLVALLRNDYGADSLPPQDFKGEIDYVRQQGLDGWILWRYSGLGCYLSGSPNIVDYLSAINMTETFTITNINVETTANSARITWLTTLPTTSKVEYSINPLFNSSWKTQSGFHFWNITYIPGTMIIDYANVTEHSVTIRDLSPGTKYYFRIQSVGMSGTVTSKVMTFTTS